MSKMTCKITYFTFVLAAFMAASLVAPGTSYAVIPRTEYNPPPTPRPLVRSLSPDTANWGDAPMTVTVVGSGFRPGSVGKVNGETRRTTFIDESHLMINVSAYDMRASDDGFYVTVSNPDGKYSNAGTFSLENSPAEAIDDQNAQNYEEVSRTYSYDYSFGRTENRNSPISQVDGQGLAGSVILGGGTFLPNGLVQWVLVAIIVVAIIILIRKAFGARDHYDNTPLKHA